MPPIISVTNNSTVLDDKHVSDITIALQHQVTYHFRPFWAAGASLRFTGKVKHPDTWELAFLDDSDQAGALGYHDYDPISFPVSKIFAKTDLEYNYSPSVTASHEALEMLADPYIFLGAQVTNTKWYAQEVGDPVEADQLGYNINIGTSVAPNKILISDFILPRWFIPGAPIKYDFMGHLTKPLEVANGGYVSIYDANTKSWGQYQQKAGELVQVPLEADNPRFRDRNKAFVMETKLEQVSIDEH